MQKIWEVRVSDGTRLYFESQFEADFYAKDTAKAGLRTSISEFPMPSTPKEFIALMERIESDIRPLRRAAENCDALFSGRPTHAELD